MRQTNSFSEDALRLSMLEIKSARAERIEPKLNDSVLNEVPNQEATEAPKRRKNMSKWKKLAIVARSIQRFRSPLVERISSAVNLKKTVSSWSPTRRGYQDSDIMHITHGHIQSAALKEFRDQAHLFEALERASPEDLEFIKAVLSHDPKKNMYEGDSLQRLSNKPNPHGQTPLYIACKNGNLELVKLLLDYDANSYQPCNTQQNEKELILTVAAKWGYVSLVKYLLSNKFMWTLKTLQAAYENANGDEVKSIIKKEIKKNKGSILKRILTPKKVSSEE